MTAQPVAAENKTAAVSTALDDVPPLKIVIVGHVDHGKSTLVGHMLHDTGALPAGKVEAVKAMSEKRGMPFEWAFVMDALKAERDQGITIDTAQIFFHTDKRKYVLIDAPGHHEFIKNMVTGAASADAAVLVIDAVEGVREQTRRHGYLLHLLGIDQVTVAMNKMDMAGWSEARYNEVADEVRGYLDEIGVDSSKVDVVPVSAREGDNLVNPSTHMDWYKGETVIATLDGFEPPKAKTDEPLRLPVQDVYKFDERRIIAGRIETGELKVGDELTFSPSNKKAIVNSIETWKADPIDRAYAGQSVGITLDHQIFVERGEVISAGGNMPMLSNVFKARLFWLGHNPIKAGNRYKLKLGTAEYAVIVESIEKAINVDDLSTGEATTVERNCIGEVVLRSRGLMALDPFTNNARTGRFVLVEDYDIVGGGLISMDGYVDQRSSKEVKSQNLTRVEHRVDIETRWANNGHRSGILWFTGLSASGKSTLAFNLEQLLFKKGYNVYVLDGDNIRHGLSADLGFSPEDRAENIRRVAEAARLLANAGSIVLTAFISPYRDDRDKARTVAQEMFHEVYVKADVEECAKRDPKGLYQKAKAGEIPEFTGISAPYEEPLNPELVVDTANQSVEDSLDVLADYIIRNFDLKARGRADDYEI